MHEAWKKRIKLVQSAHHRIDTQRVAINQNTPEMLRSSFMMA